MNRNILWETVSVVFSPLLMPLYMVMLYYFYTPELVYVSEVFWTVISIALSTLVVPLLLILVLKFTKKIDGLDLPSPSERRLPILITIIMMYVAHYILLPYVSTGLMVCLAGMIVSLIINYISLWWTIISVHAMGVAGVVMGLSLLFLKWGYPLSRVLPALIVLVVAFDLVVMARIEMKKHTVWQIILGTVVGAGMQVAAFYLLPY